MIKSVYFMECPPDLSIAECQQHWFEVHGQHHVSKGHKLRGYTQHPTLIAAFDGQPRPTHVGASIVWSKDFAELQEAQETPAWQAAREDGYTGLRGGPVFKPSGPIGVGRQIAVKDGATTPFMVKAIFAARRNPDLAEGEFTDHWRNVHGALGAKLPGLRRYVQNQSLDEAKAMPRQILDGWSELWFDDHDAFVAATKSPEWQALSADGRSGAKGRPLFDAATMCFVLARERNLMPGHPIA